jgi:hypothetical protein
MHRFDGTGLVDVVENRSERRCSEAESRHLHAGFAYFMIFHVLIDE